MNEPLVRSRESEDAVLVEFWASCGLDRAALGVLDSRIRLRGYWEESLRPGVGNLPFEDLILDVHQDEDSILRQITRVDVGSENSEVVVSALLDSTGRTVIEISQATLWWAGPGDPVLARRRPGAVVVPTDDPQVSERVGDAIVSVRSARRSRFRNCTYCGRSIPPEERYEDRVCQGCASAHLGVVY